MINFLKEDLKDLKVLSKENNFSYPEFLNNDLK